MATDAPQIGTPLANVRHERFAQLVVSGENGRQAWLTVSPGTKPESADVSASRLLRDVKVAARIAELRASALVVVRERAEEAIGSAAWIIEKAGEVVNRALDAVPVKNAKGEIVEGEWTCNLGAATPALALLAKRHPEFRDQVIDQSQHLHLPEGTTLDDLRALRDGLRA